MRCFVFILVSVWLIGYVFGGLAEQMAETTQLCCGQGTKYARNHTSEECSSSVPPDVQPAFGSLCIFAMDQCCKEYFVKKRDCDSGMELGVAGKCDGATESSKEVCLVDGDKLAPCYVWDFNITCEMWLITNHIEVNIQTCCTECARGKAAGSTLGDEACGPSSRGNSAEEFLAGEAYEQCCKKAANEPDEKENKKTSTEDSNSSVLKPKITVIPSLCEEYAPNELCAHHCIPVPGSYKCECNPGFKLMADGRNCIEVVKNRCKPHNPCQHKCNDNGVDVKCSCRRGFQLMPDGKSCKDIDECTLTPSVCLSGTECHNIQGSYRCIPIKKNAERGQCPPGFARNLRNSACDDVNECTLPHPPCPSYICENTVGGYKCDGVAGDPANLPSPIRPPAEERCPPGFRAGLNEECEDVDECALSKDDCNSLSQFCVNTRGSFYCQDRVSKHCPPGFKINPRTSKCEDIDECEDSDDICRPDQVCVNQLGQYDCKLKSTFRKVRNCPDGMRLKQGSAVCEDIDECVEGTHLCDQYQNCLNTNGSHECSCKIGFDLDVMTRACVDVNECATDQHDCITETQRCDNTVGSYLCIRFTSCGTGYILHHSTGKCEDIDECALGTHNCARAGSDYHCVNIPGSFRCVKKRVSTTSTTASPEYEYYYDSDEDITEGNATNTQAGAVSDNKPESTTSTTTQKSEISSRSTELPSRPTESQTGLTKPDENARKIEDERINEIIPSQPTERTYEPLTPSLPKEPAVFQPTTSEVPNKLPEIIFNQPEPEPTFIPQSVEPEKPYYEPRPTEPTKAESPSINDTIQPDEENGQPDTTRSPIPPTLSPAPSSPSIVYVNVGKETATVKAEKDDDGAIIINTKDIPKNEWTKINEKPTDCQLGFESDDYGNCVDINECVTNQHKCSGLTEACKNTVGGYLCECATGFRRDRFSGACDLIIVTSTSTTTSSTSPPPTTTPKHYFWGYPEYRPATLRPFRPRNLCDVGFHMNSKTGNCEDVNECVNGQANCAAVEICVNTDGGYRCECPPNWHLDEVKHRCVPNRTNDQFPTGYGNEPTYRYDSRFPVDPKGTNFVEPEITPVEDRGSVIRCPWGYRLGDDNTCEDINECVTGNAKCGPLQICTNIAGGYSCSCPSGYRLVGDHECEDVDECLAAGSMPICSQNADCINTVGSYQCRCHEGFRSAPVNDKVCVDVDECTENRAGSLCEHRCNNVWGSYRCSCHRGYRLRTDNSTCSDIDECTEFKSKVPCVGKCVNIPGSYRCACPSGYRLSEDKRSCIDIDECETGEAPCAGSTWGGSGSSSYDVCHNTRGSYRCHRIVCPAGFQLETKNRCTRLETACSQRDWECNHQPSTYSYNFITFVSNLYIPASRIDLFTMKGPTWTNARIKFELRLVDVNAPPSVKTKADIDCFVLIQNDNQGVVSLVKPLEGPQSIELELIMVLHDQQLFGGIAVAKIFIFVSEYEF